MCIRDRHHRGTLGPDLAVPDLHPAVDEGLAHRAQPVAAVAVDGDEGGAFGNAVALEHLDTQQLKLPGDV